MTSKTLLFSLILSALVSFAGCRDLPKQQQDDAVVASTDDVTVLHQGATDDVVAQTDVSVDQSTDVSQTVMPFVTTDEATPAR